MIFPTDDTPFADDRAFTPGISLAVDAGLPCESAAAASCLRRQVFDLAAAGLKLSVSVESSSPESQYAAEIEYVFELVAEAMLDAGVPADDIVIVIGGRAISPRAAWRLRCRYLGSGSLFVRTTEHLINDSMWRQAWELSTTVSVGLLCVPFVLSPCRLLPAEPATGLVPQALVQAPPGSAWATVDVDLSQLSGQDGEINTEELDAAVCTAVTEGERLHSEVRWPTARLRHDAWLNRRLAINISGIGTLVARRGLDPECFAALDEMSSIVSRIRECAVRESRRIAAAVGHVPALEQADLANALPGGRLRDSWSERWRLAVEASALRHRNLLVISPWSLFPPGATDLRYANLLPLLRYADTCAYGAQPDLAGWKFTQFKSFYQQAAAVLLQRSVPHQIAVQA